VTGAVRATARTSTHEVRGLSVVHRPATGTDGGLDRATPPVRWVLLVHGAMDRAASFGRVMRRLPEHDCLAVDRRGYAGSQRGGIAPTLEHHVDDLVAVLDHFGADRVVVVGHSLGGRLALALAARRDPRVAAVAAFEPPAPELDGSRERIGGGAIEVGLREGPAAAAEHFYRGMVGDHTWGRLRDRDREARRAEGPALLAELVDLRDAPDRSDPGAIEVPVLLGVGELSAPAVRSGAVALREVLPGAPLVEIPGAGHGAHLTHPGEFAGFVRRAVALAAPGPAGPGRGGADPFHDGPTAR